jgi:diguanylate cyclase (GGDEF)-like protein
MCARILLFVVALLSVTMATARGLQGLPLMQRFTPRDHHASATSVAVLAAPGGYVYVGNDRGLLRFDGSHWDLLQLPGRLSARAIALDPLGTVYVGTYDRFGRAEIDATGAMHFVDMTESLRSSPQAPPIGQVWLICSTDAGMYVYSDSVLTLLASDGRREHWPINPDIRAPYCTSAGVFARVHGRGMSQLGDEGFALLPGGEVFKQDPLYHVFDTEQGPLAVGEQGFYRLQDGRLQLLPDTDGHRFADYPPYAGAMLPNGDLVFGTYGGELLHFSADLRLLTAHSVTANTIFELAVDGEGGLWAATEGDLLRLRFPSAWSIYPAELGLVGQAYDTAHYRGDLFVATSLGVLRARASDGTGRLEPAVATSLEASALEADPAGLLITDRMGVLRVLDPASTPERLVKSDAPVGLLRSRRHPQRVYSPAGGSLDILESVAGEWLRRSPVPLGEVSVSGMEEDADGALWLGDTRGGPLRLQIDATGELRDRQVFGQAEGLQLDPEFGSYVLSLDGEIHVISGERVQRFRDGRFAAVNAEPFNLFSEPYTMGISETAVGTFAYSPSKLLLRRSPESDWLPLLSGAAIAGGYSGPHLDDDGMVRLGSWDGVLQYDPRQTEANLPELAVRMRSIHLRDADGRSSRQPLGLPDQTQTFPAGSLVQFDFSLPTTEPAPQFRLRIRGMFDEFSAWGPVVTPALNLRVPGPGSYVLEVEGRTPSGRVATPLRYSFRVQPQWWQQPLTRAFGILLALAMLGLMASLGMRWRYRRYVEINRALEARIAERTAELETANAKLAELATEDTLTGIANRRALEQALNREWDRCRELGQPLAVIMVDVDHFKQFNDRHGHLAGDQHLIGVAAVLKKHARPVRELLARFGGEEFVLVLPGLDAAAASERAERLRRAVEQDLPGTTISAGVAAEVPREHGEGPTGIVRRADTALYRAKRKGRNRVEIDD